MRKILIVMAVFLSSCQNGNHLPDSEISENKHIHNKTQESTKNAIYDRYKNKGDRYTQFQDGAPIKEKFISFKEPVPKKEPLSRYGNPTEYRVDGKSYQVIRSTAGYKTRGIASWYGTKFHKQRTSSGEPYNMYIMSAAHKTLPLPSYVKVKNLNNGKVAVVRVNDRGPFHSDRIIDLSYAAALKLGVFPKGTAPVEIETLASHSATAYYYLQAGAFSTELMAKRLKDKLGHLSSSPVFIEHYQGKYLVRVGPFASKTMADSLKQKLAHNGISGSFSVLN
jgi:rare lipoprotein A